MSATKANKTGAPATTNNLAMLTSTGDLADSLVESDGAGNITANLTGNVTGSADTLTTGRTISLTGDATGTSGAFDGSGNVSIAVSLAADSVDSAEIAAGAVGSSEIATNAINNDEVNFTATALTTAGSISSTTPTALGSGFHLFHHTSGTGINFHIDFGSGNDLIKTINSSDTTFVVFSDGTNVKVSSVSGTNSYNYMNILV